jgi:flavin reductase (DIM6/NTAB) family NADH-FMN oxidoreductase RutF
VSLPAQSGGRRSLDPAAMRPVDRYRLLIGSIVPRPIAWVTTHDGHGVINLAPFSFFNGVTANPPVVQVCIAHRQPEKDTWRNLRTTGEAVIHLVPPGQLDVMHGSSAEYPPEISEVTALGLATRPAEAITGAILDVAEVAFECRLLQAIPVGDPPTQLCLLQVVRAHLAEGILNADELPDPHLMRAVARLGGDSYLAGDSWQTRDLPRVRRPQ